MSAGYDLVYRNPEGHVVPLKCGPDGGLGRVEPCDEPGSQPRCQLCPRSPNYWRNTEPKETQ